MGVREEVIRWLRKRARRRKGRYEKVEDMDRGKIIGKGEKYGVTYV